MIDAIAQWPELMVDLLPGLWVSIKLTVVLVITGTCFAIGLALALRSPYFVLHAFAIALVEVGRGMPALIILYLTYFGLADVGLNLTSFVAAAVALGLNFGAYTTDVFASGLDAVNVGQVEAAQALGLPRRVQFLKVVLPQAVRTVTPAYINWVISYFQGTSLAFAIAVPELMSLAYQEGSVTFEYFSTLLLAGLLYAVISIPGSQLVAALERRQEARAR